MENEWVCAIKPKNQDDPGILIYGDCWQWIALSAGLLLVITWTQQDALVVLLNSANECNIIPY